MHHSILWRKRMTQSVCSVMLLTLMATALTPDTIYAADEPTTFDETMQLYGIQCVENADTELLQTDMYNTVCSEINHQMVLSKGAEEKKSTIMTKDLAYTKITTEQSMYIVNDTEAYARPVPEVKKKTVYRQTSAIKLPEYEGMDGVSLKACKAMAKEVEAAADMDYSYLNGDKTRLTPRSGVFRGPSGKETYYNLTMGGVIYIMRRLGYSEEEYPYWIREDGVRMFGDYVMVAADLSIRPKGTILESSMGTAIVVDTGDLDLMQLDIAVSW